MAIDKITDIISRPISQERMREATSGKKEITKDANPETNRTTLEDVSIFSEDAKRLQETEVILQNALHVLKEMDLINHENLQEVKEKLDSGFYENEEVIEQVVNDIFPEQMLRNSVEKRVRAEKYVQRLNEMDEEDMDTEKLAAIREKIESGYYNSNEVIDNLADTLSQLVAE